MLEIPLVMRHMIPIACITDVNEVIGDSIVFAKVFPCADIHSPVHLSGIRTDDLPINPFGYGNGQLRLPRSRWPKDNQ